MRTPCVSTVVPVLFIALSRITLSLGGNISHGRNIQNDRLQLSREEDCARRRRRLFLQADGDETGEPPVAHSSQKHPGDDSCPCLSAKSLADDPKFLYADAQADLGPDIDLSTYGVGCAPHDVNATICSDVGDCAMATPLPPDCDRSWCRRPWCYVDTENCSVMYRSSDFFKGRHYSYATCGFMDSFTNMERLSSLRNKTLKVALNHNSGGWKGAYNPGGSFDVHDEMWEGPIVKFVRRAALDGGFNLNITKPPEWLEEQSGRFFGGSSFDYCVYATSLGYLDMCIAAYTITDKRASVTTFFETSDDPIYLIAINKEEDKSTWESFWNAFTMIFRPFTLGAWLMIMIFSLPFLGLLMFFHEYGAPGSAYPRSNPVMVQNAETDEQTFATQKVPMWKHTITSLYMGFLAFFQQSYNQSVVTLAGKINLLAISSFVLLVLNVYTANLAAILTDDISQESVSSIEAAVKAGYNFCSERKVAEIVMNLYDVDPDLIVPDPIAIGGDGKPGFNCPDCSARQRVFDYMRKTHEDRSLYCNAAFASWEDLQILQQSGNHCNKARVGEALAHQNIGIPMFEGVSGGLQALFHQIKNDGVMERELSAAEPESQCSAEEKVTNSLSIQDLTGIWVFAFSFVVAGLIAKLFQHCVVKRKAKSTSGTRVRSLQRYDQWGIPTCHDIFIDGEMFDPDAVRGLHLQNMKQSSNRLMEDVFDPDAVRGLHLQNMKRSSNRLMEDVSQYFQEQNHVAPGPSKGMPTGSSEDGSFGDLDLLIEASKSGKLTSLDI